MQIDAGSVSVFRPRISKVNSTQAKPRKIVSSQELKHEGGIQNNTVQGKPKIRPDQSQRMQSIEKKGEPQRIKKAEGTSRNREPVRTIQPPNRANDDGHSKKSQLSKNRLSIGKKRQSCSEENL
jgi:hypothetical protein